MFFVSEFGKTKSTPMTLFSISGNTTGALGSNA